MGPDDAIFKIIEESPENVVYRVGMDEVITYISPSVEKMFGYKPGEIIGKNIKDILTPEAYLKQKKGMEKAFRENKSVSEILVLEVFKKNGDKVFVEVCARFDRNPDHDIIGIMGVARKVKISQ